MVEILEHADLQLTPVEHRFPLVPGADQGLPAHAREVERNRIGQVVPPGVLETLDKVEGLNQRLMLRRRAKRQHVGQAKPLGPVRPIKPPHQGPVILMVGGRDVLVTLSKDFGSTILRQNIPHALA